MSVAESLALVGTGSDLLGRHRLGSTWLSCPDSCALAGGVRRPHSQLSPDTRSLEPSSAAMCTFVPGPLCSWQLLAVCCIHVQLARATSAVRATPDGCVSGHHWTCHLARQKGHGDNLRTEERDGKMWPTLKTASGITV
ncbi:hypothetical protein H920_19323 [Fukomys damarensis]|uniref:Uncharacterized protein n=1 Tax=Fukomys damarensis TaxID=885580 RepID=A0A091CNZ5_FUKDA|nr:hypothetical protein H920_19323 [Fukomys damarensis]